MIVTITLIQPAIDRSNIIAINEQEELTMQNNIILDFSLNLKPTIKSIKCPINEKILAISSI